MSNTSIDELIYNTVLKYDSTLSTELDILFNNVGMNYCATPLYIVTPYTASGNNVDNINYTLRYANLIPNIFRQCWCDYNYLPLLNSCPIVDYTVISILFSPLILEKKIIKGIFYYGLSDEIEYNGNNYITMFERVTDYRSKIKNINTRQNFDILNIIINIYNPHSMFIKFYNFIVNLQIYINRNGTGKISTPYLVSWYTLISCNCQSGIINDTTKNNVINKVEISTIDFININNLLIANSEFRLIEIIKYFKQVFNDVSQQILFILNAKEYCLKPYMLPDNIPNINEKYQNYVINYNNNP